MTDSGSPLGANLKSDFASSDHGLSLFAIVWATATLVHLLSFHFWALSWQGWMLVLFVALVLMRPSSLIRLTGMVLASLANLYHALPFVPNHILFEGMVNLTILVGILWTVWKRRQEIWVAFAELPSKRNLYLSGAGLVLYFAALNLLPFSRHLGAHLTIVMMLFLGRRSSGLKLPADLNSAAYRDFSGVLRVELVVMYFWAVIQKLNWDYFNPAVSCAAKMQRELEELMHVPTSPDWFLPIAIWGSLIVEGGIPLLLLFRQTRPWGFLVALMFHFWLALHFFPGIYSFSALVFGMLVLFLPRTQRDALYDRWMQQRDWVISRLHLPNRTACLGAVVIILFYVVGLPTSLLYEIRGESFETFQIVNMIGLCWFVIWAIWLGWSYLGSWLVQGPMEGSRLSWSKTPAWIGLLLVINNGLNPWMGLKTQNSFAMFSNLRTEFDCNHLFLKRVDLFSYQQNMVEIRESEPDLLSPSETPKTIEQFANPGRIMPYFELRRLLSRTEGDLRVTIAHRSGETEVIERKGDQVTHPQAFQAPSLLEYKLLWFRRLNNWEGPMPCTH